MKNEIARSIMRNVAAKGGYEAGGRNHTADRLSEQDARLLIEILQGGKQECTAEARQRGSAGSGRKVTLGELSGRSNPEDKQSSKSGGKGGMISLSELAGKR